MKTLFSLLITLLLLAIPRPADAAEDVSFELHVRPILTAKCLECHGLEAQESHLRLDRRSSMLSGGDSGEPAIIVGDSAKSHLIALVSGHEAGKLMPPDEANRLTESQIQILRTWIDSGAVWPGSENESDTEASELDHWSFKPVAAVVPPSVNSDFVSNPIDSFILQKLTEHSIAPNPRATKAELIRRIYLDMLGLPPTPEEVSAFGR